MTSVFKFVRREYANAAVERGQLRLSGAWEFREFDGVDAGRADPDELVASATVQGGEESFSSGDEPWSDFFTVIKGGKRVPVDVTATADVVQVIDSALLFCSALDNTEALFERMRKDFGIDAAYEIADIEEFGQRVCAALGSGYQVSGGKVRYVDRMQAPSLAQIGAVDALVKPARFAWQQEYRLVFRHGSQLESQLVTVPGVCELLSIVR